MLFCQLLFQERSAKQSTGRYVFAHCSFLGSNSSPTGRKVWKLWVPIHQSSLMQVYYISAFQRCFRCRVPKPDIFFVLLGISWDDSAYSGELGQQARCSLSRFQGKSGNSWPWMPTSTDPTFSKICGMSRLCSCRHVDIMDMPEKFWSASFKQHWSILSMSFQHG